MYIQIHAGMMVHMWNVVLEISMISTQQPVNPVLFPDA